MRILNESMVKARSDECPLVASERRSRRPNRLPLFPRQPTFWRRGSLSRCFRRLTRAGNDFPKIYILIALAQLQVVKGDPSGGIETGQQALALAEQAANPLEQGAAHRALAQAHEADDDDAAARAQFQNSLVILGKIQSPPELAQSLLAYGRFQLKTNAEDSREHLERALAIFEELGATGWIEETRAALASA